MHYLSSPTSLRCNVHFSSLLLSPDRGTAHFSKLPGTHRHPRTENISVECHLRYEYHQLRTFISPNPFLFPLMYWPVYSSPLGHSNLASNSRKVIKSKKQKKKKSYKRKLEIMRKFKSNLPWPSIRFIRICPVYLAIYFHIQCIPGIPGSQYIIYLAAYFHIQCGQISMLRITTFR